ncbi:MAG: PQQ-binding-like beta-propeller repeat protein, partial [bacterium]
MIKGPNGTVVLFDEGGGETWADACNDLLKDEGIENIHHAIASQYHADHIGGLDNLQSPDVKFDKCWDRGGTKKQDNTDIDATYLATANEIGRYTVEVDGTTDINLGSGAMLYFLSVGRADTEGVADIRGGGTVAVTTENAKSITALITYGGFDFYVGGDAEGVVEKAVDDVIINDLGRSIDVLHIDHHGSVTNQTSSVEFLSNMAPEVCITSVWDNLHGHPTEDVMDRVDAVVDGGLYSNIRLRIGSGADDIPSPPRCTANGHVYISTDGVTYSIWGGGCSIINHATDGHPWPMYHTDSRHIGRIGLSGPTMPILGWSYLTGADVDSSPAIAGGGSIYVGSRDSGLYAFSPIGALAWSYLAGNDIVSAPAIDISGTVYTGSWDSTVYACNSTGGLKWSYLTGGILDSSPVVSNSGRIYVGGRDNYAYVLTSIGSLDWSYRQGDDVSSSPAVDATGQVYVGALDDRLYVYTSAGALAWSYLTGGDISAASAVGSVYIGSGDNNVYAFSFGGALSWSYLTGGALESSPAIGASGEVYIGGSDNNVYELTSMGAFSWSYRQLDDASSSPAVDATGQVYIGSLDNVIYAYTSSGALAWTYA